jgi:hypothetical protein
MTIPEGYFVDWSGNVRKTTDPGGGFVCEVDMAARYVGVKGKGGALMHEATFYKSLEAIAKAGIKGSLVAGSEPWGSQD